MLRFPVAHSDIVDFWISNNGLFIEISCDQPLPQTLAPQMDISDTCFIELVVEVFSGADHIVEIATFLHLELVLPTVRNIARDVQASILGHWGNCDLITALHVGVLVRTTLYFPV